MNPLLVKSVVKNIVWPGLPDKNGSVLLSLLYQMERSQFYSSEELFAHQRRQLKELFRHAFATVPFYKDRFTKAGFDPDQEITPEAIEQLPILTRSEFQNTALSTTSTDVPSQHGKPRAIKTSGTTGRPVVVHKTPLMEIFWVACLIRGYLWHKRDFGGKLAVIRWLEKSKGMTPQGQEFDSWDPRIGAIYKTGPTAVLNIASKLADQAKWLTHHNPDYLVTYSSNLMALLEYFESNNLKLPNLRHVTTMSEVVTNRHREACRNVWGVPINDLYTCEEAGYLAHQCPEHDHYHVQSENVYLEVVNDAGVPCQVGEKGRVLITSLHNFATPLIRYEVGDYAELGEPCPCGRGLPVITRIYGRERNRLILPDGRSEFPYLGEHHEHAAITTAVKQFQYVQHSLEEIEKRMVVSEPLTPEQEEKEKELIIRSLGHPFRVTLSYHDELPRSASGKFEEFICEVQK